MTLQKSSIQLDQLLGAGATTHGIFRAAAPLALPERYMRAEPWLRQSPLKAWLNVALQAPDVPLWAQRLAGRMCRRWLQLQDAGSILRWVGNVVALQRVSDANVQVCVIWALIMTQQYERAEQALRQTDAAHWQQDSLCPLNETAATVRILQVWLSYYRDLAMARETRLALLESCMGNGSILQPMLLNQYALLQYSSGNLELARSSAERATQVACRQENLVQYQLARGWTMAAQFMLGKGFVAWLQLQSDFDCLQHQQRHATNPADPALQSALAIHQACQAYLCYEANQVAAAQTLLTCAMQVLRESELGLPCLLASVTQAKLFLQQGNAQQAEVLLLKLEGLPDTARNPRIQAIICYERMRARWYAGQTVDDLVDHYQLSQRCVRVETLFQETYQEEHLFWLKSRLLALLIQQDFANASEHALKGVIRSMGLQCQRHLVTFYLFKAYSEFQLKREADAVDSYNQALWLCQQCGYRRVLLDDGEGLFELFQLIQEKKLFHPNLNPDFIASLQQDLQQHQRSCTRQAGVPRRSLSERIGELTEKEVEILRLLAEGLCNKKIALRASIALTTVKWHLQNIFSKLEARNRTEAVLKAQEMQLLESVLR